MRERGQARLVGGVCPTSSRAGARGSGARRGAAGRKGPRRSARGRSRPAGHRRQGPSHCAGCVWMASGAWQQGGTSVLQACFFTKQYTLSHITAVAMYAARHINAPRARQMSGTLLAVIGLLLPSVAFVEGRRRSAVSWLRADAARPAVSEVCAWPIGSQPSVLPSPASRRWRASPLPSTHLLGSSHHSQFCPLYCCPDCSSSGSLTAKAVTSTSPSRLPKRQN
jgi:hypothetical protein